MSDRSPNPEWSPARQTEYQREVDAAWLEHDRECASCGRDGRYERDHEAARPDAKPRAHARHRAWARTTATQTAGVTPALADERSKEI